MKKFLLITTILISTLTNAQVEARLPFSNIDYNSMSLRPLNLQETDFSVRFYINIGGSVDRIITLGADSVRRDINNPDSITSIQLSGVIQQIGRLFYESNDSIVYYYNEIEMDYMQVDSLLKKVQNLNLQKYQSRKTMKVIPDQPNSLYTIELKTDDHYHTFYFNTLYPTEKSEDSSYGELQNQIFLIFPSILQQIRKN
jgi:hypothetical protein